ncbi:MAG: cation:proton antiporter [Rothia sp. (in: high G+C Gram-positive bacteria)]|nr:cation:proton antiporter [Rothia sp. (in: high G+C Gram-positive bacteria)]
MLWKTIIDKLFSELRDNPDLISVPVHTSAPMILASTDGPSTEAYISLFWIALVTMLSPLISSMTRKKLPDVVILLILGMIIGPNALALADTSNGISLIKNIGLGVLFLLAGYEVNTSALKSRQGGMALATWIVSFIAGLLVGAVVTGWSGGFSNYAVLAIAMSSTALGTILPMVRNNGKSGTRLGQSIIIHGAIGECAPIFAMALLLSSHGTAMAALILLGFCAIAVVTALIPHRALEHIPGLRRVMAANASATTQTMLRLAMLLLVTLMMVAAVFELDVVLGAFAAGIILRSLTPDGAFEPFSKRLDVLGFSFLIPLFFVTSGMGIKVQVLAEKPLVLVGIVLALLTVRGLPVVLTEKFFDTHSGLKTTNEKVQLGLYAAAGLPILVAVTEVAEKNHLMTEQTASLLVAGGALTILVFPLQAVAIDRVFKNKTDAIADPGVKSTKEKITDKKAERNKIAKVATSTLKTVPPSQVKNPALKNEK